MRMREISERPPMVLSYLRFSSAEQAKGDSVRRQLELSEKYAAARGWDIDKSLSDKGVSAYRGSNATSGALAQILEMVKAKRIPRGSVLLVESLDRLSREEITTALELFMQLIRSGVRIVTLADGHEYREGRLDLAGLMYSLMIMSRAHEESATKSARIGAAWAAKRERAAKEPLTAMLPGWLTMRDGRIAVDADKAAVVKRVFALANEGHGLTAIAKRLNNIGRSYVAKILHSRAVFGEFQPHKIVHADGKRIRQPAGEPIKGYFPVVVSEADFYAAQAALANRRNRHGGPNTKYVNLFKGLLFDADDSSPLQMQTKGIRRYVSSAAMIGRAKRACIAFPVAAFEAAFLSSISETTGLNLEDGRAAELTHQLRTLDGRIAAVEKRIASINATLTDTSADADPAALVPVLSRLDADRRRFHAEREAARQQLAAAKMGSPTEAAERIAELMAGSMTGRMKPAVRFELQQAIARLVERIDCRTRRHGACTDCGVTVTLRNGTKLSYLATVKNRCPSEVVVISGDGDKTYISVSIAGRKTPGVSLYVEEQVKRLWRNAVRPVVIAKQTGVSLQQVYRIAGRLRREKEWKPANRWDARRK